MKLDRRSYLQLALVPGVGPVLLRSLLDFFGSAEAVLAASLEDLNQVPRVGPVLSDAIRQSSRTGHVDRILDHCEQHQIRILIPDDPDFPTLLSEIADPPTHLFVRGSFEPSDQLSIAIVGSRHATHYGKSIAEGLARSLGRAGLTVVSGLAKGIDAFAHRGALDAKCRTIAFLGSGLTDIYPPENTDLANQITESGAIVSETDPFSKPKPGVFPQRNRLISGMSLGVIVVEAAERSGALITATHAGEQGRDLFAIPGPVNSRMSRGCNQLIRDGAILVQDADDVLSHLGPLVQAANVAPDRVIHAAAELKLNEQEQQVLQAIDLTPTDMDQIAVRSGLPIARVLSTIGVLEMRKLIIRTGGRSVQRRNP